jgi:hypothetical protein
VGKSLFLDLVAQIHENPERFNEKFGFLIKNLFWQVYVSDMEDK